MFGALNGGTYFNTDLIGSPGPNANVSWDFTTLPGWSMSILLVEGEGWGHYTVSVTPSNSPIWTIRSRFTITSTSNRSRSMAATLTQRRCLTQDQRWL